MIEFRAGSGPDSQSVGIALEEGFLDYRITSEGPAPSISENGARIEGLQPTLLFLANRAPKLLLETQRAAALGWLAVAASGAPDAAKLDQAVANSRYILGEFSIADAAIYPIIASKPVSPAHANIALWVQRMTRRSATGRGMGAIPRTPS